MRRTTVFELGCVALVLGLSVAGAAASAIHVTTTADGSFPGECTLRDAILASNTDTAVASCPAGSEFDVIQLQREATYALTEGALRIGYRKPPIRNGLRIQGHGSTIDGQGVDRVIRHEFTRLDLHDLTITGGDGWTSGGGMISRGVLTGHNVRIEGNEAVFGGGLYLVGPIEADLNNWSITDNTAAWRSFGHGGGVYVNLGRTDSSVTLRHCRVEGNTTAGRGGGIYWSSRDGRDELRLYDSSVSRNTARSQGGGVYARSNHADSSLRMDARHATFAENRARAEGGGLYLFGRRGSFDATIRQSDIAGNSAVSGGGVGAVEGGLVLNLIRSTVSGNQAVPRGQSTGVGGGILSSNATTILTDVTLTGNSASGDPTLRQGAGGAVINVSPEPGVASLFLVRTQVFGNDASLARGVATVSLGVGFTAETSFRQTTICEGADTCASDTPFPTTQISLGGNVESDDRCGFSHATDQVNGCGEAGLSSAAPEPMAPAALYAGLEDDDPDAEPTAARDGILPGPEPR